MSEPTLRAESIGVQFGDFRAVDNLSLSVTSNNIHSLIGPNGAGKTTLFNALTGVSIPTSGRILFGGVDVTRMPIHKRVSIGMGRSFQITAIFPALSVADNVRVAVQGLCRPERWVFWRGARRSEIDGEVDSLIAQVGLASHATSRAGDLSHAAQRALEIAMALASKPKLVFLDEPLAGMSIDDVHKTKDLIVSLRDRMAVVLIEHNMSVVLDISDRVTVLAQGRKIAEGAPSDVRSDPVVREAYLGSTA